MKATILVIGKFFQLVILSAIASWLWPIYFLGRIIWGRPPIVVRLSQVWRYLGYTWSTTTDNATMNQRSMTERIWITMQIVEKVFWSPILGIFWFGDEILYGSQLQETSVTAPFFIASAGRSGSTQIGLYLAKDKYLAAPNILQCFFPYLWMWKLAPVTIGKIFTKKDVRQKIESMIPPELLERHEGDPFQPNTFDGPFYSFHLNYMAFAFGPEVASTEFGFGRFAEHNRQLWEEDFVQLVHRLAQKTLLQYKHANTTSDRQCPPRFMLKGHFLCAVPALKRAFPDAQFLTMIREPAPRLQSSINFLRVNPPDPVLGPVPWECLAQALVKTEQVYCEVEQKMFGDAKAADESLVVLRFSDFCSNLEASMKYIYDKCFHGRQVPEELPKTHPSRQRTNYTVNRSLKELNIDEDAFNERLASYISWCRSDCSNK